MEGGGIFEKVKGLFGGGKKPDNQQITNPAAPSSPGTEVASPSGAMYKFPTGQEMGQQMKERTPGYQSPQTATPTADLIAQLPNVEPPSPISAAPSAAEPQAPQVAPDPLKKVA